jgi:hypothetical protein
VTNESESHEPEIARADAAPVDEADAPQPKIPGRVGRFVRSRAGRVLLIAVGVVVIVAALFAIPVTRYALAGLVIAKDARVTIVDSVTHKPVSGVRVVAGGVTATSDAKGVATLHGVAVGPQTLVISKQYYRDARAELLVPIAFGRASTTKRIVATGYPLEVHAVDRITGAVISGAHVVIGHATSDTDSAGVARIVLPIKVGAQSGSVTKDGYNSGTVDVDVSKRPPGFSVELTTTGTIRFLSKATGTINVMEADLDGGHPAVVLAGTGNESDDTTTLLSTRDWKFSALLADRGGKRDALYLLAAGGGAPVTIDDADAQFTLAGWQGHTFFWVENRTTPTYGLAGHTVIMAFDADTGKSTVVDKNVATGSASTYFAGLYIQQGELRYARAWSGTTLPSGSTSDLVAVDTVTFTKKVVKSFPSSTYITLVPYEAEGLYLQASTNDSNAYFSYEGGAVSSVSITDDKFASAYPTFLLSPSGKQTLWAESRDGKNTIFVGDEGGSNGTQIATLSDYTPYGWFGADDRYILLTKNDSELYIARAGAPLTATNVLKVTDYHKPPNGYPGYGSGYGG